MAAVDGLGRLRCDEPVSVVQIEVPGYPHLRAFDEVAVSLTDGLRSIGLDADLVRGAPVRGRRNVLLGAHVLSTEQLRALPAGTIVYNHEQIDTESMLPPARLAAFERLGRWDYSRRNVEAWRSRGLDASHVPIGWSPALRTVPVSTVRDVDVLFYGSINERRRAVLRALEQAGVRLHVGFGLYGAERDAVIARSRLVINIQHYEARILEMVRLSHLFANAVPVVSECSPAVDVPSDLGDAAVFAAYDELVDATLRALDDPAALAATGARGRECMERLPWRRCLGEVLPASVAATSGPVTSRPVRGAKAAVTAPESRSSASPLSPFGVVVLGMHRSGTSALTELLVDLGLAPGSSLLGATPDNPRGHFEPTQLVQANDQLLARVGHYWHAPPGDPEVFRGAAFDDARRQVRELFGGVFPEHGWVYKDPRLCVLWPFYEALFPLPPVAVFLARTPAAVADSLHRRDGMSVDHALDLWEHHNRTALGLLPWFSRQVVVTHDQLLADPASVARRLATTLGEVGMEVDPDDLAGAGGSVEPRLVRASREAPEVLSAGQRALWDQIATMAEAGRVEPVEPPSGELRARMDRRARLVQENIRHLQLGWLEPVTDLRSPASAVS